MNPANDDIECARYVVERFIDGLRAGAPPVPKQVTDWCLKVKLGWEIAADGNSCGVIPNNWRCTAPPMLRPS